MVDMRGPDGVLQRLAVTHSDERREGIVWDAGRVRDQEDRGFGAPHVATTGESQLLEVVTDDVLQAMASGEEHLRLMRGLEPVSAAIVPLRWRGELLGTITLVTAESGRRLGRGDLALLERLADRAAQAIDNAELYRASRDAERSSDESRALLDTLFERAPVGMAFFDRELRFVRVNEALAQVNGMPASEHVGRTMTELLPAWTPGWPRASSRCWPAGSPWWTRRWRGRPPPRRGVAAPGWPATTPSGRRAGRSSAWAP